MFQAKSQNKFAIFYDFDESWESKKLVNVTL